MTYKRYTIREISRMTPKDICYLLNCKNWRRWHYNKYLKTDEGVCCANPGMCIVMANNEACEEFDEL